MKNLIIIIILTVFSISFLNAQNIKKTEEKEDSQTIYTHQAGFTMGSFYGLAPTYRYNFNKNALQVSALPVFNDGEFNYSFSIGYLRKLVASKNADLSFVTSAGISNIFLGDRISLSTGTQVDIKLSKFLTLEGRFGIDFANYKADSINDNLDPLNIISPAIGIGLMYNFLD